MPTEMRPEMRPERGRPASTSSATCLGGHTFASSTRQERISSKHWSPTARLDWRARSSACGWLPNLSREKTQDMH